MTRTVTTYMTTHNRIRAIRGKACARSCEFCGEPAREWAYDHLENDPTLMVDSLGRRFSPDLDRYLALCKPCHQRFDKSQITHCPQGHEYAGANLIIDAGKRKCRTCVYARNAERRRRVGISPEQHAKRMERQRERRAAVKAAIHQEQAA